MKDIDYPFFHFDNTPANLNGKKSSLLNFWSTMFSQIESNTVRGKIGEYIVSWAVGAEDSSLDPWQAYDLMSPKGKKIEVKTTSYLQNWDYGVKNRTPKFVVRPTRKWNKTTGLAKERTYNANIYVLCYYSWLDKKTIDVLNLNHWKFWVFSKKELIKIFDGHQSITTTKLEKKGHISLSVQDLKSQILSK